MRLDVEILGTDKVDPEVSTEEVEAGHVQPWMLLHNEDTGEVYAVAADPQPFQKTGDDGRLERWVEIPLTGWVGEPVTALATDMVDMVFGADLDQLHDLLDEDLLSVEQEALARNGMCPRRIDDEIEPEAQPGRDDHEDLPPVYCGRPSDPGSYYRYCVECDQIWRNLSDRVVGRRFGPTYGPIPAP